ncbi:MAG: NAD(P)/FAD-dependent oxidoreductase, partial [Okeania sp. SIO1H5]|nr:NAD(P)/FAD-dependent oxidoreductase [Okeania sp. SIO1H5]
AIEFRIEAQDQNPNHYTFWIGHEAVKKGYIWIFPKVKSGVVNLGAGDVTPKMGAKNMYDVTMEMKNRYFPDAKLLEVHGGAVPVSGNMVEYVADRFALVGDAAHHTNPMTGGGIISGMCAADFAATRITEGLTAGNLSKEFLFGYQEAVWNRFGRNHEKERKIASFLFTIDKKGQVRFLRALRGMVEAKFSRFSKLWGYLQIAQVALQNAKATLKVLRQKSVA